MKILKLFSNVLAYRLPAVERSFLDPAFDLVVHFIGQRLTGARLVSFAASFAFFSNSVCSEPSIAIKADIFSRSPIEALNVFPL